MNTRNCLRDPIPQIFQAARDLDAAVTAHLGGCPDEAKTLIRRTDLPEIREWTESLWGRNSSFVKYRSLDDAPPSLPPEKRVKFRMPTTAEKEELRRRDGYHCRFCGIPLIRREVRERIQRAYPDVLLWGKKNTEQHAAFQAMWLQYDHLLPHARGGDNSLENVTITCAPCNYGRMDYTCEEVGLSDPRLRKPIHSPWDGLERFS